MYDNEFEIEENENKTKDNTYIRLATSWPREFLGERNQLFRSQSRWATNEVTRGQLILSWGKKGLLNSIKRQAYTSDRDTGEQEPYLKHVMISL